MVTDCHLIRSEKLVEPEYIEAASPGIREIVKGMFGALRIRVEGGQDRKNLQADVGAVQQLHESGLTIVHYSGLSMDVEAQAQAADAEEERQATNLLNGLLKTDSVVDWAKVDLEKFSPEFQHRWAHEASNISDETLQHLFASLLKGELESPGSVSNDTMSIARDMTKERAEEFQILCSAAMYDGTGTPGIVVGCGNPGDNSLESYGLPYDVLMRLAHHRLIVNDMASYKTVPSSKLAIFHQERTWFMQPSVGSESSTGNRRIRGLLFTPAGAELFRVVDQIPLPKYTEALLQHLTKQGWDIRPGPLDAPTSSQT